MRRTECRSAFGSDPAASRSCDVRTQSIAWRQVRSVREYEAFFLFDIARTPVVAFKAGLPDRGEGLWAELRGALEAKRYLVRSSTGGATITNTAAR